ncbi:hypothetical protein GCM10010174_51270 [Kutzneria viridogrisea]|uniref:Asp23/Gls24 family envelope stress response protein n=1 Tax=Kutzneria viridogrisea TaxID=47990 RepID=A0ABR6BPG9_9PSEU|nr:hypothetical protein [Kutzneria viridogrisea]
MAELAELIAQAVLAHPAVHRLDGGEFGVVASPLPGRRVLGVLTEGPGSPVEIAVVLLLGHPIPEVVEQLRERVKAVAGTVPVDITVADLMVAEPA